VSGENQIPSCWNHEAPGHSSVWARWQSFESIYFNQCLRQKEAQNASAGVRLLDALFGKVGDVFEAAWWNSRPACPSKN